MSTQKSELYTHEVKKQALKVSVDENEYNKYLKSEAWLVELIKDIEKERID